MFTITDGRFVFYQELGYPLPLPLDAMVYH